jgi:TPP-dependent indolepyruvate ferredoxin oxidoreductase alpha subunit
MWYGKGPGVDRCGDVFKHANAAGTSRHGGVLALAGDDHAAKSSTLPHQSEHIFKACLIPVLNPASVQDYLDLGLHGFAMSRFSGCWVAFKCVTDVVESGASAIVDPERVRVVLPADFAMPPGGLNIRWPDGILEQEARILDYKVYAALAYARANGLDRMIWDSPNARLGIATTGKSFGDVMRALEDLGIDERVARDIGLRVYKVALSWPLEPQGARRFAEGLEEILVVEEKRQVIEYQIKEELYNWKEGVRAPRVVGKFDDSGEWSRSGGQPAGTWLLPAHYEHSPGMVARAIGQRLENLGAPAVFLLGLPAQHLHARARRQPRDGGHRLPFHGAVDGPQHGDLHAHGRRGRALDRPGAFHRREARLCQPGRRHVLPLRLARHPGCRGGQGQHDLQDSLQRRRGHDRRTAPRRPARPGDDFAPDRGGGRAAHRRRDR